MQDKGIAVIFLFYPGGGTIRNPMNEFRHIAQNFSDNLHSGVYRRNSDIFFEICARNRTCVGFDAVAVFYFSPNIRRMNRPCRHSAAEQ
jgi:hypothetical protein